MISYRLATPEDNEQLIGLTAATGMAGNIGLRIDRKPDFFKLLELRGETKVFVALNGNNIIGCLCVSLQQVYVGGHLYPLQYIGDLKVLATYRNQGIGLQLCNEMANYVIAFGSDLAFLNVSKGNNKPVSFFKNRPSVPDFDNIGLFNIYQFFGKKKKAVGVKYKIDSTAVTDELLQFLDAHYSKYELGTLIDKEKLNSLEHFIVRDSGKIVAAMCLMDTMPIKQNVVTNLSWNMKWLLRVLNRYNGIAGNSKMPMLNEPVQMIYIRWLAVDGQDKALVRLLINHARNIVYERNYSFASIGLHEKDPLGKCFDGMFKLTFHSVGMLLSIKNNRELIEKVKQGIPFEDYSLV